MWRDHLSMQCAVLERPVLNGSMHPTAQPAKGEGGAQRWVLHSETKARRQESGPRDLTLLGVRETTDFSPPNHPLQGQGKISELC